jgi:hypothetical protein
LNGIFIPGEYNGARFSKVSRVTLEDELKRMMVKDLSLGRTRLPGRGGAGGFAKNNYDVNIDDLEVGRVAFASIKTLADCIRKQKGAAYSGTNPPSAVAGP